MRQNPKFNKVRDITPTNPSLDPRHKESIRHGIVRDTSSIAFYNMQKELGEVGGRIFDEFDVIEYDNALRTFRKKFEDESKKDKKD